MERIGSALMAAWSDGSYWADKNSGARIGLTRSVLQSESAEASPALPLVAASELVTDGILLRSRVHSSHIPRDRRIRADRSHGRSIEDSIGDHRIRGTTGLRR